jgi:uncharacterized protein (TIGR02246 family)
LTRSRPLEILATMCSEKDQQEIRQLIADWSAAVRRKDYAGILKNHSRDILMFDVPPPFQSQGIDAYRRTWEKFFGWMSEPAPFEFSELRITAGHDVAFVTARGKCFAPDEHGDPVELAFRLTVGLRKTADQWVVEHEHHSVPAA